MPISMGIRVRVREAVADATEAVLMVDNPRRRVIDNFVTGGTARPGWSVKLMVDNERHGLE